MKVVLSLLLLCGIISPSLHAQKKEYYRPGQPSYTLPVPDSATRSVDGLSAYLSRYTVSARDLATQLYNWMTANIAYDVDAKVGDPVYYKDTADAAAKTLRIRKGVSQGYAALYYMVCKKAGIPAYVVTGFTRFTENSNADTVGRDWVMVNINKNWYGVDPARGTGWVDGRNFIAYVNWAYCLVTPQDLIKLNMPYDPLWQFLEHPYRYDEFWNQRWEDAAKRPVFNYQDSLLALGQQDELSRYEHAAWRMEQYGVGKVPGANAGWQTCQDMIAIITGNKNLEVHNQEVMARNKETRALQQASQQCKLAADQYNQAAQLMNTYLQYRKVNFTPAKPAAEIKAMVEKVAAALQQCREELAKVSTDNTELLQYKQRLLKSQADMSQRVNIERGVVDRYAQKK